MSIQYLKDKKRFVIHTKHTTYAFDVVFDRYLYHIYYGKRTSALPDPVYPFKSFAPYMPGHNESHSPDLIPSECSFFGAGDFRPHGLRLDSDGTGVTDFVYDSYRIFKGRRPLDGLPQARADAHTETLEVTLLDNVSGCKLKLYYTAFADYDVISRYMVMENHGRTPVTLEKCTPMMLDIARSDLDMITFYGSHNREMNMQRVPLHHGTQSVYSKRGASSHHYNPLCILCDHNATEERGDAYGFNLVWSGSFLTEVDVDQLAHTRVNLGLGSDCFSYTIAQGESFTSPEAVLTYSPSGTGLMSRRFHRFIRERIMPPISLEPHPVVLNTWEACSFDINEEKLIRFASEAHAVGFDMLVMDDGWFGARNHDRAGLGDWFENREKFPDGLAAFAKKIKARGVQFGIWIEPEMVNPDSDLYRAHPEWALRISGREPLLSRKQLVLDMANPDVVDYLISSFDTTFEGVPIDYFKWDMNRHMSLVGSTYLPVQQQKETFYRYMLGVYRLFDHFKRHYPNAIIETCSGGGGRYDLGMMQYGFQIWTSDNTDPYHRTHIQASAMMGYPAATMSCHVSNPHGSMRSLDYRYKVAVGGMLGYELNILDMTDEQKAEFAAQIAEYKGFDHIIRLGEYYPLVSPFTHPYSAYYYAWDDGCELLFTVIECANCKAGSTKRLRLKAAKAGATYVDMRTGKQYTGEELQKGLIVPLVGESDSAHLYHFKKV